MQNQQQVLKYFSSSFRERERGEDSKLLANDSRSSGNVLSKRTWIKMAEVINQIPVILWKRNNSKLLIFK